MSDEELIKFLRTSTNAYFNKTAADRIEVLVKYKNAYAGMERIATEALRKAEARAERLEAAIDYILDGMAIDAPDYEIDPDDDFLDAANSDWVRDVLTRLAAAMKGDDHD
jgi:hypothetical protein